MEIIKATTEGGIEIQFDYVGGLPLDKYGDSAFRLYRAKATDKDAEIRGRDVLEAFALEFPIGGCSHEWDCCGCWSYSVPRIIGHDKSYDFFLIRQDGHRNI